MAAGAVVVWDRWRARRLLRRLEAMLDAAVQGTFLESGYDESLLSAVEARLAQYLSASAVSDRNLREEKEKIKTLIAISGKILQERKI